MLKFAVILGALLSVSSAFSAECHLLGMTPDGTDGGYFRRLPPESVEALAQKGYQTYPDNSVPAETRDLNVILRWDILEIPTPKGSLFYIEALYVPVRMDEVGTKALTLIDAISIEGQAMNSHKQAVHDLISKMHDCDTLMGMVPEKR
jgi:hypothetical protein